MDSFPPRPTRRRSAFFALIAVAMASLAGCGHWRTTRIAEEHSAAEPGTTLRLRRGDERRTVRVVRLDYPRVDAVEDGAEGPMAVVLDLTTFDEVEVYSYPRGVALTSLGLVGLAVAAGAVVGTVFLIGCGGTTCLK